MQIKEFLIKNNISYDENVSLASKSWIKFGGIASLWISPKSVSELEEVCRYLYGNNIAYDLVGQTSNIFFHSTYNPQVVVSTVKVNGYNIEGNTLTCDCGCNVMKLAKEMLAEGYAGFYGLVGLPGTVASAAVNNAGCFSCSISEMLISADVLMPNGTIKIFKRDDFGYEKRSSKFKRGEVKGVVLSVKLKLEKAESIEEEYRKSEETKVYRKTNQEGPAKNLGSVFAKMTLKYNYRNRMAAIITTIATRIGFKNKKLFHKCILLWLYGYSDLNSYISDKQLNTFVWRDADAEQKFARYKEFMGKAFDGLIQEIEEKK
jgi:UDP-N-acetylenolpyruvoylglucosamine reductase